MWSLVAGFSHLECFQGSSMLQQVSLLISFFMLLLLLSRFSRVRLCATPQTAAHQAPPSLGLSRQEHWSGLPFPSPMHACMLSHFSHVQLCATLWTVACQAPLSIKFSWQEQWSGQQFPSPWDLPKPGTEPVSLPLAGRFFATESSGKRQMKRPVNIMGH